MTVERDPLRAALAELTSADADAAEAVRARAAEVLRPGGALRRLDEIAIHVAGWRRSTSPRIDRPAALVFAGDHGVTAAGISAYPSEVTAEMLRAVRSGRATINALAHVAGVALDVVDVGVGAPTGDIRVESAMSHERFDHVVGMAFEAIDRTVAGGADLLVLGELGIGNTTISAAIPAALLGGPAADWVGRGTGVDDDGLRRKIDAVTQAVARIGDIDDPLEVMRQVGGTELAAMAAGCIRARHHRIPVVLDGYVGLSAVLPLHLARPGALDHCIVGHRSAEPGHTRLLAHLGMEPVLDLEMRLGEGSGALLAVPLVRMACAAVVDVATFTEWFGE